MILFQALHIGEADNECHDLLGFCIRRADGIVDFKDGAVGNEELVGESPEKRQKLHSGKEMVASQMASAMQIYREELQYLRTDASGENVRSAEANATEALLSRTRLNQDLIDMLDEAVRKEEASKTATAAKF